MRKYESMVNLLLTKYSIFSPTFSSLLAAGNCHMTNSSQWAMRKSNTHHFQTNAVEFLCEIIQDIFSCSGEPGNLFKFMLLDEASINLGP